MGLTQLHHLGLLAPCHVRSEGQSRCCLVHQPGENSAASLATPGRGFGANREPEGKLLFVSAALGLEGGGTAVVGRLLARSLGEVCADVGLKLEVLHLGCPPPLPTPLITVHCHGKRARLVFEILRRGRVDRPQAVIYDHLGPARVQWLFRRYVRAPFAVYLHGIEAWNARGQSLWVLRHAPVLMANSDFTARRLHDTVGIRREVVVLPPVLEDRPAQGVADARVIEAVGRGFLLMVGRMATGERYKGHDEVLDALASFRPSRPAPALVVVGGGDDAGRLKGKAATLGLEGVVYFSGFVSEATRETLLSRAAALVLPSREEGFGLVYLEAMRAGIPCIALANTAAAELIEHDKNGMLVPPGDNAALAEALRTMLEKPELARRLGEEGRRRWLERHQYSRFRAGLGRVVSQLLVMSPCVE